MEHAASLPIAGHAPETYEDPLDLMDEIERLKVEQNATILAHYYVDGEIQDLADFTGDSLKLARDATRVTTSTIVFCGVHFMAESAKILNPEKRVLLPDMLAGCSLADSCPYDKLLAYQQQLRAAGHDFVTVAYINTTAAVKSLCDWIVTSGNAREIIDRIPADKEILFVPDQHLGRYLSEVTGRKMLLWPGACMVHELFSLQDLLRAKKNNPGSVVMAHPECPQNILEVADVVGGDRANAEESPGNRDAHDLPDRHRSQHDPSATSRGPATHLSSGAWDHGLGRHDLRL
jgi:quinolinate synthase